MANTKKRSLWLFLCGGALGALCFLLIFGLLPLDVTNDAMVRGGFIERDIQQHYAGWLFYRQSALRLPLAVAEGIGGSGGLSVAFTDSIPLVAAVCRVLEPLLPEPFQYFGWFALLCCFLQGGFAALLCGLFADGLALPLLGSCLFSFSPVLLERVLRHTSLGAQWLVLAALYCYFRGRRGGKVYGLLFAVNVLTIGIHPYFVPMTYAVTLALLLERRKPGRAALYLGGNLAATAALGWALGLFAAGGSAGGGAEATYGYFCMNLNALWNPVGVNGVDWSLFLPAQNQVRGNYDAFAYLGLGVGLALLAGLPFALYRWKKSWQVLREHGALVGVCLILSIFAVSHVVTANGATLMVLPLPEKLVLLGSVFRSSGRMFWPVYYLLMLGAFLSVSRLAGRFGPRVRLGLVIALVAVQLVDLTPGLAYRFTAARDAFVNPAFPTAMTGDFWAQAAGRYAHIVSMDGLQNDSLSLALYAADHGMTTNDPFAARYDEAALAGERAAITAELLAGTVRGDTLYLFNSESSFLTVAEAVRGQAWCGRIQGLWYAIAPGLTGVLDESCVPYDENWPFVIADYSDALWVHGVLSLDTRVVCFYDVPFVRARLDDAAALRADGAAYPILLVDDSDPGWLMVTLDIPDATVLAGVPLEVVR